MPIEDHLRPGERVLASSDSIYATSRRLIRFELRGLREPLESLRYDGISAIATRRRLRLQTIILAILVILLTIAIGPEGGVRWILVVIGFLGIAFSVLSPATTLEFSASHLASRQQSKWRLKRGDTEEAQLLTDVTRAYVNGDALPQFMTDQRYRPKSPRRRRSVLLLPADRSDQLPVALNLRPDALCLDLGSIASTAEREMACGLLWGEVTAASRSYAEVLVRLSSSQAWDELEACVWPGLAGVIAPVQGPRELLHLEEAMRALEETRRLPFPLTLLPYIDCPEAIALAGEIASAVPRVDAVVLALHDLSASSPLTTEDPPPGLPATDDSAEARKLQRRATYTLTMEGVQFLGVLGAGVPAGQLEEGLAKKGTTMLLRGAERARSQGFEGALTPHWQGVEACNQGFGGMPAGPPDQGGADCSGVGEASSQRSPSYAADTRDDEG